MTDCTARVIRRDDERDTQIVEKWIGTSPIEDRFDKFVHRCIVRLIGIQPARVHLRFAQGFFHVPLNAFAKRAVLGIIHRFQRP